MKKAIAGIALAAAMAGAGCSYGGLAASGNTAVIARNDMFLFGLLRAVYVCQITPAGLTQCGSGEAP